MFVQSIDMVALAYTTMFSAYPFIIAWLVRLLPVFTTSIVHGESIITLSMSMNKLLAHTVINFSLENETRHVTASEYFL